MALDKRNRFLLRTQADGKRNIFIWAPEIAQKSNMRPISYEDAVRIQKEIKDEHTAKLNANLYPVDAEVTEDNPVIAAAIEEMDPEVIKAKDNLKLERTNDDILKDELEKVGKMLSTSQLEEYFLLKYKVELLVSDDLSTMQNEAIITLTELANANKLYEVGKR